MIYFFAIDPELAATPHDLFNILNQTGVENSRLVLQFPKKWTKKAKTAFNAAEAQNKKPSFMEHKRFNRLLQLAQQRKKFVRVSPSLLYNGEEAWITNALQIPEHAAPRVIIVPQEAPEHTAEHVLHARELSGTDLWEPPATSILQRKAHAFEEFLRPFLLCSATFHLIDPYFDPLKEEVRVVLEQLLQTLLRNEHFKSFEIHLTNQSDPGWFTSQCVQKLSKRIPDTRPVRFCIWNVREGGEAFHDRAFLTDIGGASIGHGFREDSSGDSTTLVSTLDPGTTEDLRQRFDTANSSTYNLVHSFTLSTNGVTP